MIVCDIKRQYKHNLDKWNTRHNKCNNCHRIIDLTDTKNPFKNREYNTIKRSYTYDGKETQYNIICERI